jgi:hypothetical protein
MILGACGGDSGDAGSGAGATAQGDVPAPSAPAGNPTGAGAPTTGQPVGSLTSPTTADPGTAPAPSGTDGAAGAAAPVPMQDPVPGDGSGDPTAADPGGDPTATDPPMPAGPATAAGPEDGDPSAPIVDVPGIPCGPNPSLAGLTSTNTTIGGRDVHVAYPCNKHAGAPVTFILNLHGTMPDENLKLYQVAYFSANNYVDSHNFITVAPKSVVSQWGNGDGGVDRPHIMEVIDWVYSTFADFDIRQMWVAGHSWGAMYTTTFACDPAIADKVRGAMLQSGSGMNPACADRISVISSAAEMDIGPVVNQGGVPASHGCGPEQTNMVGNNVETYWPDCNPGFVHSNYLMLGKGHIDYMDPEVVERIADLINIARP